MIAANWYGTKSIVAVTLQGNIIFFDAESLVPYRRIRSGIPIIDSIMSENGERIRSLSETNELLTYEFKHNLDSSIHNTNPSILKRVLEQG